MAWPFNDLGNLAGASIIMADILITRLTGIDSVLRKSLTMSYSRVGNQKSVLGKRRAIVAILDKSQCIQWSSSLSALLAKSRNGAPFLIF